MFGSGLWRCRPASIASHGHPRQTYRSTLALAERLRRKTDRIDPTRMRRPCDRLGRGAPTPDSASLCPLLQRSENAPLVGQRCAILAPGSADRKHHVTGAPRRTASPLHASLSFRYTHAGFDPVLFPLSQPPAHAAQSLPGAKTRPPEPVDGAARCLRREIDFLKLSVPTGGNCLAFEYSRWKRTTRPVIMNDDRLAIVAHVDDGAGGPVLIPVPRAIAVENKLPLIGSTLSTCVFKIAVKRALDDHLVRHVKPIMEDKQDARRGLVLDRVLQLIIGVAHGLSDALGVF